MGRIGSMAVSCISTSGKRKVWIQHDGTEEGIAEELVTAGIPRDRIVLAFKPPEMRPYTEFADA